MRSESLRLRQQRYKLTEKGILASGRARRTYDQTFKGKLNSRIRNLKAIKRCQKCGSSMIFLIREVDRQDIHLECIPCGWHKFAIDKCELMEV